MRPEDKYRAKQLLRSLRLNIYNAQQYISVASKAIQELMENPYAKAIFEAAKKRKNKTTKRNKKNS